MYNICLYGIDLKRRDNIPSFSFKLVFLGNEKVIDSLYYKTLPKIKCERFNDVSYVRPIRIGEKKFYFFEFIGSEKTIRSFLENLEEYKLVTGPQLLINSCDLQADIASNKRSEMMTVDRVLAGSRFEDIRDILKRFSVNEDAGSFLEEKNMYSKRKLTNLI